MDEADREQHDQFLRLFMEHEEALRLFVRSLLFNQEESREVMQEVAIVLWRKFDSSLDSTSFRRWAFGVARMEVLTFRRDRARDRHAFGDDIVELLERTVQEESGTLEGERRALEVCVSKLPADQLELVHTAYDRGVKKNDLARELGWRPNLLRVSDRAVSQLRGRRRLQEAKVSRVHVLACSNFQQPTLLGFRTRPRSIRQNQSVSRRMVCASNWQEAPARELDRLLRGQVETALFRGDWNDPEALFVGVKAGYNQAHHGHLDLGNFELDALGVRWARDLGGDNYNLPNYWSYREGGKRWSYYRLGSFSHNVPVLGGKNQNANAIAKLTRFQSNAEFSFAEVDLTEAYAAHATKALRGVAMVGKRRAVLVQDEFEIKNSSQVVWGMTTDAKITLEKPGLARLSLKGKQLTARVLSPAGAAFNIESAEQSPPQKRNKGVSRLVIRLPETQESLAISVLLSPEWKDGVSVDKVAIRPLKEW